MKRHFIIPLTTLSALTFFSLAVQTDEVPAETLARMQQLGAEFATPNQNHAFLRQFSGKWKTSSSVMGMEPSDGSASYSMILDDRYLDGMHSGTFAGVPFQGRLTIGYDNYKHKFVASFIDDLGTSIRFAEGTLNQNRDTLSLWGAMDEWMTDEHDKPVMYRYKVLDSNHFEFEVHDLSLGSASLVITVHYTKQ
jgi:hypothetical protein